MDIVLLEDVKSLGKKGQIVKVNDGYARNFILPKKKGMEATPKNLLRQRFRLRQLLCRQLVLMLLLQF